MFSQALILKFQCAIYIFQLGLEFEDTACQFSYMKSLYKTIQRKDFEIYFPWGQAILTALSCFTCDEFNNVTTFIQ